MDDYVQIWAVYIGGIQEGKEDNKQKKIHRVGKKNDGFSLWAGREREMIIGGHLMVEKSGRVRILTKAMVVQGKETKRIPRKKEKRGQQ